MFKLFKNWDKTQFVMGVASSITATAIISFISGIASIVLFFASVMNNSQFMLIMSIISIIILIFFIGVIILIIKRRMEIFTDSRDKQKYRTVKIGKQIWMAQNLNFADDSKNIGKCYEDNSEFSDIYGRLYDWETAKENCPEGWHLPTKEEWGTLVKFVGGYNVAGNKLKTKEGWHNKGNGRDEFGFSALPGGLFRVDKNIFWGMGRGGVWWSATENGVNNAYSRGIQYDGDWMFQGEDNKKNLLSIRCVKD